MDPWKGCHFWEAGGCTSITLPRPFYKFPPWTLYLLNRTFFRPLCSPRPGFGWIPTQTSIIWKDLVCPTADILSCRTHRYLVTGQDSSHKALHGTGCTEWWLLRAYLLSSAFNDRTGVDTVLIMFMFIDSTPWSNKTKGEHMR